MAKISNNISNKIVELRNRLNKEFEALEESHIHTNTWDDDKFLAHIRILLDNCIFQINKALNYKE